MFKVIIAGSRSFTDYKLLKEKCDKYLINKLPNVIIISGGAIGADKLGELYAKENNLQIEYFIPDWTIGKHAGFLRNLEMAENANALILFWDNKSKGSKHMLDIAVKKELLIRKISYDGVE